MAKTLKPCQCRYFEAVIREYEIDGQPEVDTISTGCAATTFNDFAQGHDAKLKSFLIYHGLHNRTIWIAEGGVVVHTDAVGAARRFGFAHMVIAGIARAKDRWDRQAAKADHKHEAGAEAAVAQETYKAKVGRWTYEGVVVDDRFVYTDAKGNIRHAARFTLVN